MEHEVFELKNGLRAIHHPGRSSHVAHLGLSIRAGSRDENDNEQGIAHFIEHLLFKGTKKRRAFHILNRLDSVGAELNAYTTKEETVIYASFLNEHFERAAEVISDIAFQSTFPEREIHKEKEVVLDEILSYKDNPVEMIFDDFEELLFPDQPMGRNILGTEDSVKGFKQHDLHSFVGNNYQIANMALSLVGSINPKKVTRVLEKHFGLYNQESEVKKRTLPEVAKGVRKSVDMDTYQAHVIIGGLSYDAHDPLRLPMILANNVLGGPAMNSRLNMNIREKHGIAYNIESIYHAYSDSGVFSIYLGTDKKWLKKSERLVHRELKKLRENRLSTTQLHKAKEQLKGQYALSRESGSGMMQALGKNLILKKKIQDSSKILNRIDEITSSQVLEVANYSFSPDSINTLIYT